MRPWIDRRVLIRQAKKFVKEYGYFYQKHAKRIGSLVEIAVYNSVVSYYDMCGFELTAKNLGPKKSFRYKLSAAGLIENFSYFEAERKKDSKHIKILPNTKIQSAHNMHLYYTPDVVVCNRNGTITRKLKGRKKDSYISNRGLLSFIEVKHLVPFPEVLFSFTGLVQEFAPAFISNSVSCNVRFTHLTPMIVFTGVPSEHAEKIGKALTNRYGINVVFGTQNTQGRIALFRL